MIYPAAQGKLLDFYHSLRIVVVPKYPRYRHNSILAMAKQSLLISQKQFGAVSRSLDWYLLAKVGGIGAGVVGLLVWRWQLLVATGLGIGVMGTIYFAYDVPWEKYLEEFYQLWRGEYRRLLLAVLGGASTVFVSYLAIALWQSTENHWLATACLIQGLMIGAILLISTRHLFGQSSQLKQFESSLQDLSHRSSVKRLYAIRQLRQLLQNEVLNPEQKKTLYTFLHLTWQQETESALRGALLSTLSLYKKAQTQPAQTIQKPLPLNPLRSPLKLEQRRQNQAFREQV